MNLTAPNVVSECRVGYKRKKVVCLGCGQLRQHQAKGRCSTCYVAHRKTTDPVFAERVRSKNREQMKVRRRTPEGRAAFAEYESRPEVKQRRKELRRTRKRSEKNLSLKYKYGLTLNQYEEMLKEQQGLCLICVQRTSLVVDHCHETGAVRGLICSACNRGLGCFRDAEAVLRAAINYLKRSV